MYLHDVVDWLKSCRETFSLRFCREESLQIILNLKPSLQIARLLSKGKVCTFAQLIAPT